MSDHHPIATHHHTQASSKAKTVQKELVEQTELRRRMRQMVVPTADSEVRSMLRSIGEPITLFGEREVWCFIQGGWLTAWVVVYTPQLCISLQCDG